MIPFFYFGGGSSPSPYDGGFLVAQDGRKFITEGGDNFIAQTAPINPLLAQNGSSLITESGNALITE